MKDFKDPVHGRVRRRRAIHTGTRYRLCSTTEWGKVESRECFKWPGGITLITSLERQLAHPCCVDNLMITEHTDIKIGAPEVGVRKKHE